MGFNRIVLMALADADYNFIYVDVEYNSRIRDGGFNNNSSLCKAVDQNLLNFPQHAELPKSEKKLPYGIVANDAFRLSL